MFFLAARQLEPSLCIEVLHRHHRLLVLHLHVVHQCVAQRDQAARLSLGGREARPDQQVHHGHHGELSRPLACWCATVDVAVCAETVCNTVCTTVDLPK